MRTLFGGLVTDRGTSAHRAMRRRFLVAVALFGALFLLPRATAHAISITNYPIPTGGSYPYGIVAGSDGALWFTEINGNKIGRISTSGSFTEYAVPTANSAPYDITAGPDGALWFTEYSDVGKIGRLTTSGSFTEYPISDHCCPAPIGITTGPDGNIWFAEYQGGKIGRITTSGFITLFDIPAGCCGLISITPGPDGALWYTDRNHGNIGRISTGGVAVEYPIPTANSGPWGIVAGPDGAVWFTEQASNKIGRITTSGSFTEYPIPTAVSAPTGILAGADGALWFTEKNSSKIGRITTSGSFTEYPIPGADAGASRITTGPDGALWFTESNGVANRIGRVSLLAPTIASISQANGPVGGGTPVTITGTGFSTADAANTVNFGSATLTNVTCASPTSCNVTSPAQAAGDPATVDVVLTAGGQSSATSSADHFTYMATLIAPSPGSTLSGASVPFSWTNVSGAGQISLWAGSTLGGYDYYYCYTDGGCTTTTSTTVTGLPTDGSTVYVRLWTLGSDGWFFNDYTFTAVTYTVITNPAPGSTLSGASVPFFWNAAVTGDNLSLWAGSTVGGYDYYYVYCVCPNTTVTGLPTNGSTVYVRMWTHTVADDWTFIDYTYRAAGP